MPFRDREQAARLLARHLRAYKGQDPLILAIPRGAFAVAPRPSLAEISHLADEVVCLETPPLFFAVGQFFEDFRQVEDEEVVQILRAARREPAET